MRIAVNCKNMRECRGKFAAWNLLPLFNVYPEITPHRYKMLLIYLGKDKKLLIPKIIMKL